MTRQHHPHFTSLIPQGFDYLEGNRFTGEGLRIQDHASQSTYCWISSIKALEKINKFLNEVDSQIEKAIEAHNEIAIRRLKALEAYANSTKQELALRNGVFHKEGTLATFRI